MMMSLLIYPTVYRTTFDSKHSRFTEALFKKRESCKNDYWNLQVRHIECIIIIVPCMKSLMCIGTKGLSSCEAAKGHASSVNDVM